MSLSFGLLCFISFVAQGLCIDCYRCNSTASLDCLEKFMYPNPLRAESCADVYEARYCIKTTGIYENELGTRRFCSKVDMGNLCHFIDYQNRTYKGCIYTCSSDGCNGAAPTTFRFLVIIVCASTLLFLRRMMTVS